MQLTIEAVGKYTHAQTGTQTSNFCGIGLNVSGLLRSEAYYPDGRLRSLYDGNGSEAPPSLNLAVPGVRHMFQYNANRENWIIFLREPFPFRYDMQKGGIFMRSPVSDFLIREKIPLGADELPAMKRLFQEIRHKTDSGLPCERVSAEIIVCGLLRRFFFDESAASPDDAAARFKSLIDADVRWEHTLDDLASEAGFCRDHLRSLFVRRYGVTPGEYRIRQRLAFIVSLLSGTDLSMKEISSEAGIAHASYLNQLIRKYYRTTPLELCRRLRSPRG